MRRILSGLEEEYGDELSFRQLNARTEANRKQIEIYDLGKGHGAVALASGRVVWKQPGHQMDRAKLEEGQRICVRSETSAIEIEVRLSADVRRGVVAIHQFWGHVYETGTTATRRYPGVNVNHLHSDRVRDRFSGMPVFNGTPCSVAPIS